MLETEEVYVNLTFAQKESQGSWKRERGSFPCVRVALMCNQAEENVSNSRNFAELVPLGTTKVGPILGGRWN